MNRADKSSEYRLSVKEVLERHTALCSKRGMAVSVDTPPRARAIGIIEAIHSFARILPSSWEIQHAHRSRNALSFTATYRSEI
jgi:hypothetical protein